MGDDLHIFLVVILLSTSGLVVGRGLRGWATRERTARWALWIVQGGAGVLFAVGFMLRSGAAMALMALVLLASTIWQVRHEQADA